MSTRSRYLPGLLALAVAVAAPGCKNRKEGDGAAGETAERGGETSADTVRPEPQAAKKPEAHIDRARELARRYIIVDGHIDVPYRLNKSRDENGNLTEDISKRTESGDFDYVRAVEGGLDAPFMSIYIPAEYQKKDTPSAKAFAEELIEMVEGFTERWPDKFALARSPADIRSNTAKGLISLPMGMENGAAIEDELGNVEHFYDRGIRYITLTHSKDNQIADSSYDTTGTWKGLSPFGRKVVAEMNRVGIMVDISHVSDNAFYQVLDITAVPVIASHSSARHFTVDFERNMSDEMIAAMKDNGGVIMVNFGSTFIGDQARKYFDRMRNAMMAEAWRKKIERDSPAMKKFVEEWKKDHPPVFATTSDVADHIDRIVRLAGIDHVGFGSDFDGVGDSLPVGLKDVSDYPNLIAELLSRGYSESDIEKMASGNLLRVWEAVAEHASKQAGGP